MNYDEMPAGREMDALVAEKVMGWKREESKIGMEVFIRPDGRRVYTKTPYGSTGLDAWLIWSPSWRIADAWGVVEKMCFELGHAFGEHIDPTQHGFQFGFGIDEVEADTLPLAICRSALKAMEVSCSPK